MKKILAALKKFFMTRGLGYFMSVPALVLAIVGFSLYSANGITEFNADLSSSAIAAFIVGIVVCVVGFVLDYKPVKFLSSLFLLFAAVDCIAYQANYIANVMVAIDGNSFSSEFIATAVCSLLAWLFQLLSAVLDSIRIFPIPQTAVGPDGEDNNPDAEDNNPDGEVETVDAEIVEGDNE